jgi:ABC-type multidrug transport system fused ATPase/permease subunit
LLIAAALLIVFYFILKNFIHFIFINHKGFYVRNFIINLKKDIIKNFIFRPYEFFLNQNTGFLLKNITTDVEKVRYAVVEVITILKEILLIIMLLGLSMFASPVVTLLVTLVFLIISITFYLILKKTIKKKGILLQLMEAIEIKNLLDYFNTIKIIKILEKENFFLKNYKNNLKEIETNKKFFLLINSTPRIIFETLAIISVMSVSIFFIIQGNTSNQILPTITLLIFVAISFCNPVFRCLNRCFWA